MVNSYHPIRWRGREDPPFVCLIDNHLIYGTNDGPSGMRWTEMGGWRLIKLNYMLMSVVSCGRWSIYLTQYPFPRTSFRSQSDREPSHSQSPDSFISRGDRLPFSPPCSFDQWQAVYVVHLYHRRRRRNEFVSSVYSGTLVRRWGRGKNGQMNEWTNV